MRGAGNSFYATAKASGRKHMPDEASPPIQRNAVDFFGLKAHSLLRAEGK